MYIYLLLVSKITLKHTQGFTKVILDYNKKYTVLNRMEKNLLSIIKAEILQW